MQSHIPSDPRFEPGSCGCEVRHAISSHFTFVELLDLNVEVQSSISSTQDYRIASTQYKAFVLITLTDDLSDQDFPISSYLTIQPSQAYILLLMWFGGSSVIHLCLRPIHPEYST